MPRKGRSKLSEASASLRKVRERAVRQRRETEPSQSVEDHQVTQRQRRETEPSLPTQDYERTDDVGLFEVDSSSAIDEESTCGGQVIVARLEPERRRLARTHRRGIYYSSPDRIVEVECYSLGALRSRCRYCGACYFDEEAALLANRRGEYRQCCHWGKVKLPELQDCPLYLVRLLIGDDATSRQFRSKIRYYNNHLAFASFDSDLRHSYVGQGAYCFKIAGQIYHRADPLQAGSQYPPRRNQLYFLDADAAHDARMRASTELDATVVRNLDGMIRALNPIARSYRMVREWCDQELERGGVRLPDVILGFKDRPDDAHRRYNAPEQENEVAVVFTGDEPPPNVTLKVYNLRGRQSEIKNLSGLADPMVYPLLFPYGEYGYQVNERHVGPNVTRIENNVTLRQHYAYRIAIRDGFSLLHHGGRLFQQYVVDAWVQCESNDLWFIRQNQPKCRVDNYTALRKYVDEAARERNVRAGKVCILPSSHIGSPRSMQQQYMEAMTIVARHGKPCLFVTMTANPQWPEIQNNLRYGQLREHMPHLVARVFKTKLEQLLDDFVKKQYFGVVQNWMYAIEFQKRGLPHAHILFTFADEDKVSDEAGIDSVVSAELPDPVEEPEMYRLVSRHMIHAVCDSRCMREGSCSKRFPKPYAERTTYDAGNGRPIYKRPRNGQYCVVGNRNVRNDRLTTGIC